MMKDLPKDDSPRVPLLKRIPNSVVASVIVSVVLIALIFSIPLEHRGKLTTPDTYVLAAVVLIVASLFSWHQHQAALSSKRLNWLLNEGLKVEKIGPYHGLKGTYRGYFIRVYINPKSRLHRHLIPVTDIYFDVYFHPLRTREGKRDIGLLRRIENDMLNETIWIQFEYVSIHSIHMRSVSRFTIWTGPSLVKKRLDRLITRVERYGLKPYPEAEVETWVRESPYLQGPDTELFQVNFANKKTEG